jgi:hypothetical protein
MKLKLLKNGSRFNIYAIVLDDSTCPTVEFLELVKSTNKSSHKSFVNIFNWHADNGPIINERKSKVLKDRDNLLEFKTDQGDRIMYFYLPGGQTVLTHGFHKGASESQEYKKAEKMRDQYCEEVKDG